MRQLNPKHVESVLALINQAPYFRLLNMRVENLVVGVAHVELEIAEKHLNPFGGLHGGVFASVLDTAAYWSAYGELDEGASAISLDLSVSNLALVSTGRLRVEGRRIKVGKTICLAEATALDDEERIVAHGTSKLLITRDLQDINQAIMAAGGNSLPPKFLDA